MKYTKGTLLIKDKNDPLATFIPSSFNHETLEELCSPSQGLLGRDLQCNHY